MSVYLVTDVAVSDPEQYRHYTAAGSTAVRKHGGRFLAEGATPELIEGTWLPKRMAIVEFPDAEAARRFYDSAEYTAAREMRREVADFKMVLVPGAAADGGGS